MKKYLSRKFILTVLGVAGGVATAVSGVGGTVGTIAGLTATVISTVTYVVTEGKIDAAAVKTTITNVQEIVEAVKEALKGDSENE